MDGTVHADQTQTENCNDLGTRKSHCRPLLWKKLVTSVEERPFKAALQGRLRAAHKFFRLRAGFKYVRENFIPKKIVEQNAPKWQPRSGEIC